MKLFEYLNSVYLQWKINFKIMLNKPILNQLKHIDQRHLHPLTHIIQVAKCPIILHPCGNLDANDFTLVISYFVLLTISSMMTWQIIYSTKFILMYHTVPNLDKISKCTKHRFLQEAIWNSRKCVLLTFDFYLQNEENIFYNDHLNKTISSNFILI